MILIIHQHFEVVTHVAFTSTLGGGLLLPVMGKETEARRRQVTCQCYLPDTEQKGNLNPVSMASEALLHKWIHTALHKMVMGLIYNKIHLKKEYYVALKMLLTKRFL